MKPNEHDFVAKLKCLKGEHLRLIAVLLSSSLLAVSFVLVVAFTSIFIVSVLRSSLNLLICLFQFLAEITIALVAAVTSGFTITCSILASVTTSAFILPSNRIQGRVCVAFLIAGVSTASYISAIFIFSAPKVGKELTSAVIIAAASSVAFAAAWAVGIMSLVEKETSHFGLKITNVLETIRRNNHRLLKVLLKLNICIKQKDLDHGLLYAAKIGYIECFEHLLNAGANPDSRDSYDNTPLSMACEHGSTRMIKMLLDKGVDIEMRAGGRRGTALHKAANWGYLNCVEMLLGIGANTNSRDIMDRTPLMLACIHAPTAEGIIKQLIDYHADVNALSSDSKTALHFSCARGLHPSMLLAAGCDPNVGDCDGNTPLHVAAGGGHCVVVEHLVAAAASAKSLNSLRRSPLHMAAMNGCAKCVATLLPLSNNDQDASGHHPIWYAAECGHYDAAVVIVRSNNIQPSWKQNCPHNPDDPLVAALNGHHLDVAKLLLTAGFSDSYLGTWLSRVSNVDWFEDDPDDIEWLKRFLSDPKSLRCICRHQLRRILGPSIFDLSSRIHFPEYLQNFLTLNEFLS